MKPILYVIDDQATSRNILSKLVESEDKHFTVLAFDSAQAALDSIEHQRPSVILCDYQMEPMDGIAFTRIVRQSGSTSHIPVFLITADENPHIRANANAAGVTQVLNKPIQRLDMRTRTRIMAALADRWNGLNASSKPTEQRAAAAIETIIRPAALSPQSRDIVALAGRLARQLGVADDLRIRIEYAIPLVRLADHGWLDSDDAIWDTSVRDRLHREQEAVAQVLRDTDDPELAALAKVLRHHNTKGDTVEAGHFLTDHAWPIEAAILDLAQRLNAFMESRPSRAPIPVAEIREKLRQLRGNRYPAVLVDTLVDRILPDS